MEILIFCLFFENLFYISKIIDKFLFGFIDIFMFWRVKEVIRRINIFGLILISKENLVYKVLVTGDFEKIDYFILEFGKFWEG